MHVDSEQLHFATQHGLRPQLLGHVIQSQPTTLEELIKVAWVAEAATKATAVTVTNDCAFDRVVVKLTTAWEAAEQNTAEL